MLLRKTIRHFCKKLYDLQEYEGNFLNLRNFLKNFNRNISNLKIITKIKTSTFSFAQIFVVLILASRLAHIVPSITWNRVTHSHSHIQSIPITFERKNRIMTAPQFEWWVLGKIEVENVSIVMKFFTLFERFLTLWNVILYNESQNDLAFFKEVKLELN